MENNLNLVIVKKAIFDSIYHWQNSESRLSDVLIGFSKSKNIEKYKDGYSKILVAYSINRNFGKGSTVKKSEELLKFFKKENFFTKIEDNDFPMVIDEISEKTKTLFKGNKLLSLVTKTAFLSRPNVIPLFDDYICKTLGFRYNSREKNGFQSFYNEYKKFHDAHIIKFEKEAYEFISLVEKFQETRVIGYKFFAHRAIDKYLWITGKNMK